MSKKQTMQSISRYKKAKVGSTLRTKYLKSFEQKMLYRTTKMEHPETSRQMVKKVLRGKR